MRGELLFEAFGLGSEDVLIAGLLGNWIHGLNKFILPKT